MASTVELIDYVMVHETGLVGDLMSDEVVLALHHTHLTKLGEAGLIEYDVCSRTVRYRGDGVVEEQLNAITNVG